MSRAQKDLWPGNQYARFLWLVCGLWEDLFTLNEVYRTTERDSRIVIARHMLVDFDSLDELLKEFHEHIKSDELRKLSGTDAQRIEEAFANYHRSIEPHRPMLKQIRNNLGSHRTGIPWKKAKKAGITDPAEWGKWEQLLAELESQCELHQWLDVFNHALILISLLKDFNLDTWYSWSAKDNLQFFMPIRSPGYDP